MDLGMSGPLYLFFSLRPETLHSNDTRLQVPVWIEFLGLSLPCVPFLQNIVTSIRKVLCVEPDGFFQSRPQKRVYVEIDLSQDLKESLDIQIGSI